MNDTPQFLIPWTSRWDEFLAALGPALRPSPPKLRVEARAGLFPLRGMALALFLEVVALATAIAHPTRIVAPPLAKALSQTHDIIYYSADELPRTEDLGGAAAGARGARGGSSQLHPSQMIRIARDASVREKVTDAPHLNLPKSESQLSNLLAYKSDAPTPPPPIAPAQPVASPVPTVEAATLKRPKQELALAVVPPPPDVEQARLRVQSPQLPVNASVAPPPVALPRHEAVIRNPLPDVAVAPPPVSAPVQAKSRPAQLPLPAAAVAPPTPEMTAEVQPRRVLDEAAPQVVPPPAELREARHQLRSLGNTAVAPPAPDLSQVAAQTARAYGLGVTAAQPPAPTRSSPGTSAEGVIVSPTPGNRPATSALSQKATLAMSPAGSANTGVGGQGGGQGISRGSGTGASPSGTASGAASSGDGKSTVVIARNTNSPYPGPGGAGIMTSGNPRVPGVSVSGGKNVITLPSFGSTPEPSAMAHSAAPKNLANGITVVASPRAGGALNLYGALKGDRVYTIYISTKIGTAVMQFADPASVGHPSANQLIAPRALRAETPAEWAAGKRSKVLIACELDRNGILKNARILRADDTSAARTILVRLSDWKFAPALRGNEPVEVNAILGFGVDTN